MGFRTQEEEGALDAMSMDEFLVENKEATFMLWVKSDSMKEAGILCGDLVIVDRSKSPKASDIVIGVVGGEFIISRAGDLSRDAQVEAVVTAVVRKYA